MKYILIILAFPTLMFGQFPTEILNFDVKVKDWGVLIQWTATGETPLARYEVEHARQTIPMILSSNPPQQDYIGDWQVISSIAPKATLSYVVSHVGGMCEGNNYYRLRIVDNNEGIRYSPVRVINWESCGFRVFPNPSEAEIHTDKTDTYIKFYDINGRLVLEGPFSSQSFDVSRLASGQYIIVITSKKLSEIEIFIKS